MSHINKIYDHFDEAHYSNLIKGQLIGGVLSLKGDELPIFLRINELDEEGLLTEYNETPIRIQIDNEIKKWISPKLSLLWVTAYREETRDIQMVYINARLLKVFEMPIDIAYSDELVQKQQKRPKGFDALEWQRKISDECIFTNGKDARYQYLCIEEFDNNDKAFLIRSIKRTLEIKNEDGKWIITKDNESKRFPRKHSGFSAFTIYMAPKIRIVEKTKAGEAFRLTKQRITTGTDLMSLWAKYTELEVKKAQQFQSTFGEIRFKFLKHLPNKLTKVQFEFTEVQRDSINSERETLSNMALELQSFTAEEFGERHSVFKIYRFLQDSIVEIIDEDFEIQKDGVFGISILGDEAIKKRRDNAYKQLINPSNEVIRDLLFAIEGQDAMSKAVKHHQALTERTRSFLKKNFGITDLNDNQKKAIEIALNTPDLAVIQGPPGTGKSTVVAAICDRIQEIAERESNKDTDRLILVSAFQNDTVEHISSKIKTMGLPTIKFGKGTMSLPAEMEFINQTRAYIQRQLESMPDSIQHRASQILKDILEVLHHEYQTIHVISLIEAILPNLDAQLQQVWNAHFSKDSSLGTSKLEMRLNALITTPDKFFTDGGNTAIRRLLMCEDFHPTDEERDWLDMETPRHPEDTPDGFFDRLTAFRDKYLEPFKAITETTDDDEMFVEAWLNHAIEVSQEMEKSLFANKDNYKASVLNEILQELSSSSKYIRRSIQAYSESIAATNQVAGGREMMLYPQVQNVVLEEAARSNPLDLLIPMVKATRRIIMVGDHKQLPHLLEDDIAENIVQSETNIERKTEVNETLKESLFGRIFNNIKDYSPKRVITLNKQFRMHPFIGDFISRVYYDGVLESQEGMEASKVHGLSLPWAKDKVAVFANVSSAKYGLEKSGKSKSRKAEATKVIQLVKEILADPASKDLSIGVITFYASQVTAICEEAIKAGYMERGNTGDYRINSQYQFTADGREKLRIGSVDSFQGKEFDVVILSTVRSNKNDHMDMQKAYGFLSLANRLNVAFSRAQKLLIVVGDGDMFNDEGAKENVEGLYEFYTNLSTNVKYGNRI